MKSPIRLSRKGIGTAFLCLFLTMIYYSCSDDENTTSEYNPNERITLTTFSPDSGGIGTKMIIEGGNFGSDTSQVKVYFNQKKATIIKAQGNRMYLFAPRLPGDTCIISVVIGKDSVTFDKTFRYLKRFNVSTITGQAGTGDYSVGTTLDKAKIGGVNCLAIDGMGNIFITNRGGECTLVNQESNMVSFVYKGNSSQNAPTVGDDNTIYIPADAGSEYYELSPETDWTPRYRLITQPSDPNKQYKIDWKHSLAFHESGDVYTAAHNGDGVGHLVKFNAKTRVGEKVTNLEVTSTDTYLYFDPNDNNILYMVHSHRHCIYRYYLDTNKQELFAGTVGREGWRDGTLKEAEFNWPRQITLGPDGYFYIADERNHCIRQITPDGRVNTVVGIGGKSGYQDGNPDEALFNSPKGVALDKDGNIYVADNGNSCLRKLTME